LSLRRAVFQIFDFKKCRDLEIRVRGDLSSLKVVPFDSGFLLLTYSNFVRKTHLFEIFDFKNYVTLKIGLRVSEGH